MQEPSVDELMQFSLTLEQQQPEADLGKSLREVRKNVCVCVGVEQVYSHTKACGEGLSKRLIWKGI
jgi:hypothetical protein